MPKRTTRVRRVRRVRRVTRAKRTKGTRVKRRQAGGFFPYSSAEFGAHMVDSKEAGGAVVIRNVSGVPTVMSVDKYRKEYRGEYDEGI
jgi:hypothetical protein